MKMAKKKATSRKNEKIEPKGYSLHIGLNRVSKKHYNGWDGGLRAPEADAIAMQDLAKDAGFKKTIRLLTARAKREAVIDRMLAFAKELNPGDLFFLSYSGHGGQAKDLNDDEFDRIDETWCLYDGQMLDDEIFWCLSKFKKGVRIIAMIDCCHSGTSLKAIQQKEVKDPYPRRYKKVVPMDVLLKTLRKNNDFYNKIGKAAKLKGVQDNVEASIIQVSACQDDEVAYDGHKNSLFTEYMLKVWKKGKFEGSHKAFYNEVKEAIPFGTPNYFTIGPKMGSFTRSKPFKI